MNSIQMTYMTIEADWLWREWWWWWRVSVVRRGETSHKIFLHLVSPLFFIARRDKNIKITLDNTHRHRVERETGSRHPPKHWRTLVSLSCRKCYAPLDSCLWICARWNAPFASRVHEALRFVKVQVPVVVLQAIAPVDIILYFVFLFFDMLIERENVVEGEKHNTKLWVVLTKLTSDVPLLIILGSKSLQLFTRRRRRLLL